MKSWSGKLGSNQRPLDYRSSAQTALSFSRVEPRVRFELTYPDYRSGASPSMLTGLKTWSQRGYSKPQPPRYECGALPPELLRLGADGDNRNLFSGLEAQGTPYIPRPLTYTSVMLIQLSKTYSETHLNRLAPAGSKLDEMPQIADKTKKEGGHFWWPPSS